jgi:alkanesulfonate monooxygenase
MAAARALGATAIEYPKPAEEYTAPLAQGEVDAGIRVGIISRDDDDAAWAVAHARFPEDRKGQLAHQLAMKVSDSSWHRQLSGSGYGGGQSPYWLIPFQNYKTMCPYLVGSHQRVGEELARYIAVGYRTLILDVPVDADDLHYSSMAVHHALEASRCHSYSTSG